MSAGLTHPAHPGQEVAKRKRGRTFDTQTAALLRPIGGWDDGNLPLVTAYQTAISPFDFDDSEIMPALHREELGRTVTLVAFHLGTRGDLLIRSVGAPRPVVRHHSPIL